MDGSGVSSSMDRIIPIVALSQPPTAAARVMIARSRVGAPVPIDAMARERLGPPEDVDYAVPTVRLRNGSQVFIRGGDHEHGLNIAA